MVQIRLDQKKIPPRPGILNGQTKIVLRDQSLLDSTDPFKKGLNIPKGHEEAVKRRLITQEQGDKQ